MTQDRQSQKDKVIYVLILKRVKSIVFMANMLFLFWCFTWWFLTPFACHSVEELSTNVHRPGHSTNPQHMNSSAACFINAWFWWNQNGLFEVQFVRTKILLYHLFWDNQRRCNLRAAFETCLKSCVFHGQYACFFTWQSLTPFVCIVANVALRHSSLQSDHSQDRTFPNWMGQSPFYWCTVLMALERLVLRTFFTR